MIQAAMFSTMARDTWTLKTGNLVYMTSNNAPSPYVATTSDTPSFGSAFNAFDSSNTSTVRFSGGSGVFWAKMMWTNPIKIQKLIIKTARSGQPTTATKVFGIKADNSEVQIYSGTITSNTDTTVTSTDIETEFVGVKIQIDKRSDLTLDIYNCRITEWYEQ